MLPFLWLERRAVAVFWQRTIHTGVADQRRDYLFGDVRIDAGSVCWGLFMWSACVNDNFMFFRSRPSTYIVSVYNQVDDVARVGRQSANCRLGDEVFQLLQTEEKFPLIPSFQKLLTHRFDTLLMNCSTRTPIFSHFIQVKKEDSEATSWMLIKLRWGLVTTEQTSVAGGNNYSRRQNATITRSTCISPSGYIYTWEIFRTHTETETRGANETVDAPTKTPGGTSPGKQAGTPSWRQRWSGCCCRSASGPGERWTDSPSKQRRQG